MTAPRISVTGNGLPASRVVSRTMHPDEGFHDHAGTIMVIAWGQFMDHDYTLTATPLGKKSVLSHININIKSYEVCSKKATLLKLRGNGCVDFRKMQHLVASFGSKTLLRLATLVWL